MHEPQSFLLETGSQEGAIQPEPAYLRDVVTYTEGKEPKDDFPRLADILVETGDHKGLVSLGFAYASALKDPEQALACFDQALELEPHYSMALYDKGVALGELGRYEEAVKAYEQATALESDYFYSWVNMGNMLTYLGRHDGAINAYEQAINLRPEVAEVWLSKSMVPGKEARHEEELEALKWATKLDPDLYQAWCNQGMAAMKLGRYEDMIKRFRQ